MIVKGLSIEQLLKRLNYLKKTNPTSRWIHYIKYHLRKEKEMRVLQVSQGSGWIAFIAQFSISPQVIEIHSNGMIFRENDDRGSLNELMQDALYNRLHSQKVGGIQFNVNLEYKTHKF